MTDLEFTKNYEVTDYKHNILMIKSKETNNYYYVENLNGYHRLYINFDPSSKKSIDGRSLSPDIYNLLPGEDYKERIIEVDDKGRVSLPGPVS